MRAGERIGVDPGGEPGARLRRAGPVVVAVVAVVAVLVPLLRSPAPDGFPLSTYPMFARDRGADTWVDTVIGRDGDGRASRLSPELISGADEPVLASATVTGALAAGGAERLCARVADRVAESSRTDVVEVQVVSERQDLDRFEPDEPIERRVRARCPVPA